MLSAESSSMSRLLSSALEALGSAIPSGLAALIWIGLKIGPEMIPPLLLAMFSAIAVVHFSAAASPRPIVYTPRFFEISLLVGFIDAFVPKLALWGLDDTPATRLTLVLAAGAVAALMQPVFYGLRLQRLTRFIPAPVFAGFLNAVALILIVGQVREVMRLQHSYPHLLLSSLAIAGVCLAVALAVKIMRPQLPAGIVGLLAASLTALLLQTSSQGLPAVMPVNPQWVLPIALVDWQVFNPAHGKLDAILGDVALTGFLLAVVVFLSTISTQETMAQLDTQDDKPEPARIHAMQLSAGQTIAAALGSLPLSGSPASTVAAGGRHGVPRGAPPLFSLLAMALYVSGLLAWLPQAAMIGLVLYLAYTLFDRPSALGLWRYATDAGARRNMSALQREDLALIAVVALFGVLLNMVAALVVGMVLGLVLFAWRNGRSAIKEIRSGCTWRSNCVRPMADIAWLDVNGSQIQCVRLHGALYFGVSRSLRSDLETLLPGTKWLVVDWQAVVSHDTTLLRMFDRFEAFAARRGVQLVHCARPDKIVPLGHDVAAHIAPTDFADLDRVLEFCENRLLEGAERKNAAAPVDALLGSAFVTGLKPEERTLVLACFEQRHYQQGDRMIKKGETSRDLYIIDNGHADVVIADGTIRVAGISAGAIFGEMGFLDGTPRAADVYATRPLVSLVMSRRRFDDLSRSHPAIAQAVMQNLCCELARRLRSLHLLLARERL
jgi:sulfate permease, SulP family